MDYKLLRLLQCDTFLLVFILSYPSSFSLYLQVYFVVFFCNQIIRYIIDTIFSYKSMSFAQKSTICNCLFKDVSFSFLLTEWGKMWSKIPNSPPVLTRYLPCPLPQSICPYPAPELGICFYLGFRFGHFEKTTPLPPPGI